MAHHAGHMLLVKKGSRACDRPPHAAGSKIMAISNTIDNNNVKIRVYFPTIIFVTQIADANSPIELRITINHAVNSIFMITQCQYHSGLVLLLTILSLLLIELIQWGKQRPITAWLSFNFKRVCFSFETFFPKTKG